MCNHFRHENPEAFFAEAEQLLELYELERWEVRTDAWPKADWPVIYQGEKRTVGKMRWGVWPQFEPKMPARPLVNARDDALLVKRTWKEAVATRRCVVPADGYFEWCGPEKARWEVLFQQPNKKTFFIAALWSPDPTGGGRGFTLVTGRPNELVAALPHDRMPVVLERDAALAWIGNRPLPEKELLALCAPFPSEKLVRQDLPRAAPRKITTAAVLEQSRDSQGELF